MKKCLTLLPVALMALTGCCCNPITELRYLVEDSTYAIWNNADAVECSTATVCENIQVTRASTETIAENQRLLEKAQ